VERASEGVMTCGRVAIGREMIVGVVEARSWEAGQKSTRLRRRH
jgi:hypothetical protein